MKSRFNLQPGRRYLVLHRGGQRPVRRIFKWIERRFGSLPCQVFTSQVTSEVQATWIAKTKTLRLRGLKLPSSELSIPDYDLIECKLDGGQKKALTRRVAQAGPAVA